MEDIFSKLNKINYFSLLSKDDPTRFNKTIATNSDSFIIPMDKMYEKCSEVNKKEEIIVYWLPCVNIYPSNRFRCPVISKASLKKRENTLKILLNVKSLYLVSGNDVLLCPGYFSYIDENSVEYRTMERDKFLSIAQDKNFYLSPISYKWSGSESHNILPHLTDFHTQKVQRGFYSPKHSLEYQIFEENGRIFNTEGKSYYESLTSNEDLDFTLLPFYEYPVPVKIKLYSSSCFNLKDGELTSPLLLSIIETEEYKRKLYVDLQLIDLNFAWREKHRKKGEKIPDEGSYSLSPDDSIYLQYSTHSPACLVAVHGYIKGDKIEIN